MGGAKWLYISSDKVFKVPQPKEFVFKAIKELAGQDVLKVMVAYETKNRKPYRLFYVEFSRIRLDAEGAYEGNKEKVMQIAHNAFQFIFSIMPEDLANRDEPIVLPIAPTLPTSKEKTLLYDFLNSTFPILGKDAPIIVEQKIRSLKESHQERINMIKDAKKLRGRLSS